MASGNNRLRKAIAIHTGTAEPSFGKGKGLVVRRPKKRTSKRKEGK